MVLHGVADTAIVNYALAGMSIRDRSPKTAAYLERFGLHLHSAAHRFLHRVPIPNPKRKRTTWHPWARFRRFPRRILEAGGFGRPGPLHTRLDQIVFSQSNVQCDPKFELRSP